MVDSRTDMQRWMKLTAFAGVALAVGGFFGARFVGASRAKTPTAAGSADRAHVELRVPHVKGSITLDGDLDDTGWLGPLARTGAFVGANGAEARPYSDARAVWGDGHLYLALYAADEDVRATSRVADGPTWVDDSFRLVFTSGDVESVIDISAAGVVTDSRRSHGGALDYSWDSGLHVSTELDGTMNDPRDEDEEWTLEVAIPFESLGMRGVAGERIGFSVRRCDTPKGASRVCASWGERGEREGAGMIVLE